jgi:hypothetical protein
MIKKHFLVALFSALVACSQENGQQSAPAPVESPEEKAARELDARREETRRVVREMVSATLKDPDSARFRNQQGICGEANAKNSFGGYVGFQRFIMLRAGSALFETEDSKERELFQLLWQTLCERKGLKKEFEGTEYLWDAERKDFFEWNPVKNAFVTPKAGDAK